MLRSHTVLKILRKIHLYLGVFTAPALLFFAFTGALQTFSLHETTQGSSYKPPAWAATLAQLHKKQTIVVPVRKQRPAEQQAGDASKAEHTGATAATAPMPVPVDGISTRPAKVADTPAPRPKGHLPMKIFFLLVAVGLFLSTVTGIYMAYRYSHNKLLISGLLAAGIVIPLLLLPF